MTAKVIGNRSSNGILLGLTERVQSCSNGKNGMLLTGLHSLMLSHRLMNSGQDLSQLACEGSAQETQYSLLLDLHVLVQCFSPHVPHVSALSRHLSAK